MFESALIESQKRKAPKCTWLIINTALILHALDVPDDLISEDYLLTNRFYLAT